MWTGHVGLQPLVQYYHHYYAKVRFLDLVYIVKIEAARMNLSQIILILSSNSNFVKIIGKSRTSGNGHYTYTQSGKMRLTKKYTF